VTTLDRFVAALVFAGLIAAVLLVSLAAQPSGNARRQSAGSTLEAGSDGTRALYEYLEHAGLSP
jgi:hypothetical protein